MKFVTNASAASALHTHTQTQSHHHPRAFTFMPAYPRPFQMFSHTHTRVYARPPSRQPPHTHMTHVLLLWSSSSSCVDACARLSRHRVYGVNVRIKSVATFLEKCVKIYYTRHVWEWLANWSTAKLSEYMV